MDVKKAMKLSAWTKPTNHQIKANQIPIQLARHAEAKRYVENGLHIKSHYLQMCPQLKCSGEKSRCQRCKNRGYKCVYTNDKSGGQKRKHHAEKDGSRSSAPSKASSSNEMEAHSSESDATSSRRLSRYPPTPSSFRDGEISEMQRRRSQNLQQMGDDQVIRSMMESVADMEGTTMNESSAESDKELFSQLLAPFQTSDDLFAQVLEDSHENSDGGIVGMEDALMNLG